MLFAIQKTKEFIDRHYFEEGHDLKHALAVVSNVQRLVFNHPVEEIQITRDQAEDINLAALLHDVDDRKFFSKHQGLYKNARKLLQSILPGETERHESIIYMISLVSASSNGNSMLPDHQIWLYYPRFADRLEAIGPVGVERCRSYSIHSDRPMFLDSTPRVETEDELWRVATPERFRKYLKVKESVSFIDHFYDKLLHIGTPQALGWCTNPYLVTEAADRHLYMVNYILVFGLTGEI